MSAKSLGILLAVTALAVVAALFLARENRDGIPARGQPVFPELKERINRVSEVKVVTASGAVTIARNRDVWVVREKHDYRAAMDKVRSAVIGLAELTVLEPKTKNPEHHAKLGLLDVTAAGSEATRVTLRDAEGAALVNVLIGNREPSRADSARDEIYLRKADEAQTWLAIGRVRPEQAPIGWIDRQILNIDTQRVRQVRVTHPDGHTVLLRKAKPADVDFRLLGVPTKAEIRSQFSVNNIADTVAHLTLDDVQPREDSTLPKKGRLTARLETFDGLRVTTTMVEQDGRHRATLSAEFDRTLVQQVPSGSEERAEQAGEGPGEKPAASGDAAATLEDPDTVQQDADTLKEQLGGWVYVLPRFRAETLATRTETLIKQ